MTQYRSVNHATTRKSRGSVRVALLASTTSTVAAILLVFAYVMAGWYGDVGGGVAESAATIATAVAQEVDRNIELLDFSLQEITQVWGKPPVSQLSPELRDRVIFDNATRAPGFGSILVIDQNGELQASSSPDRTRTGNFSDRDYFRVHLGTSDVGLFVSKPFVSRVTGQWIVALSRRIEAPGGGFGGVVVGTLHIDYLTKLYASLRMGHATSIVLLRIDGTIITTAPYVAADVRRWAGGGDAFNRMRATSFGSFEGESPVDGRQRIISFHRVGKLPLIQAVEVTSDEARAGWWRKTAIIAALLLVLCAGVVGLSVGLYVELGRRMAAEAELALIATTDALTGLPNRRRFEQAIAAEWSRAIGQTSSLALLMIDADYFKAYNDRLGHLAGDAALKALAECLAECVRGTSRLACRYGGEEFAVLIPSAEAGEAHALAETIRHAVQALALPHPEGHDGVITVSLGSAACYPSMGESSDSLIAAADGALYRAKVEGRNRCRFVGPRSIAAA